MRFRYTFDVNGRPYAGKGCGSVYARNKVPVNPCAVGARIRIRFAPGHPEDNFWNIIDVSPFRTNAIIGGGVLLLSALLCVLMKNRPGFAP